MAIKNSSFYIFLTLTIALFSCEKEIAVSFEPVQVYIVSNLGQTIERVAAIKEAKTKDEKINAFVNARAAYKKAEPFAAYINIENTNRVNGPPLPVFREDNGKVLESISFQSIEEQLFSDQPLDTALLNYRLYVLKGYLENLKSSAQQTAITPKRFFVPLHLQLMRVFALGITSFDTPTSLRGVEESIISLEMIEDVYRISIADTISSLNRELNVSFLENLKDARTYLEVNHNFDSFNRYEFGREHINKLTNNWVEIRQLSALFEDPKVYALNLDAPTFFENNSFNVENFRSSYNRKPSQKQIDLGKQLFFDNRLSMSGTLSCASCHVPEKYYQDGLIRGVDKDGNQLKRNTPTLVNAVYQKRFFWDGRSDNLEQQINVVFSNEKEFDQSSHQISADILQDSVYAQIFTKAYPEKNIDKNLLIKALATYTSTLKSFNSRFDKNMRGESSDFSEAEIQGMNLFMGKALCATCHFVPLTNGTVPPAFSETEREILGTPKTAQNLEVDDDLGFYPFFEKDIHKYMFKTPTIRNVEFTAPYMHNGVYASLEEVMDFYNKGGGAGMGFDLPHQTLPFDSLNLTTEEIGNIIAFMKTLSDNEITY